MCGLNKVKILVSHPSCNVGFLKSMLYQNVSKKKYRRRWGLKDVYKAASELMCGELVITVELACAYSYVY